MLELVDVHTYYATSHVLRGVTLSVGGGSAVALLGRNGMGKTTTIHSIIGFVPPRQGAVRFQGEDIMGLPSHRIAKKGIGLVPQGRRIFPSLTVKENLTMAARNGAGPDAWSLERVYSLFPILEERAQYKGTLLSGGEQQMLCIGRALMTNPALLLLDEPSEGLAPIVVAEIGRVIRQLRGSSLSILLVEQNLYSALEIADYIYIISKGEIVYGGTPEELSNDGDIQTKYLTATGSHV